MVLYHYEDKDEKVKRVPKKVYMIINGEKMFIDPGKTKPRSSKIET